MIYILCFIGGCLLTWLRMAVLYRAEIETMKMEHFNEMQREFANEKRVLNLMRIQDDMLDKYESECI